MGSFLPIVAASPFPLLIRASGLTALTATSGLAIKEEQGWVIRRRRIIRRIYLSRI